MQTRSSQQPSMFDEFDFDAIEQKPSIQPGVISNYLTTKPTANLAYISEEKILDFLTYLKSALSLEVLRNKLAELKGLLSHAHFEELPFDLTPGYLIAELDQISASLTLDRAKYYVERLEKSLTQVKTSRVNDINLNRWKEYEDILTDSLWVITRRDNSGVHSAGYWGNFIPQIPQQMIKRYTKKGELVLDTFLGSGTTLIESQRLGRNGIGVELQAEVAANTQHLINSELNIHQVNSQVVVGDSASIDFASTLQHNGFNSAQLLIMHPPYHDIIKFSDNDKDLSNATSTDNFVQMMVKVVKNAATVLDKRRYLVLVIGDKYAKGEWIPLGFLTMNAIMQEGFTLKSIIVKNFEETTGKRSQKELWRYRALAQGFYVFKHEYIFLLQKI